jgi:hypothetical protein
MSKHPEVVGHWHALIEGFSTSSREFYDLVTEGIKRREIPDLAITTVEWKQSGLGSGKRLYLRVSRESLNFDICAAPFGTGFFFSWWLAKISRILLDIGFLAALLLGSFLLLRSGAADEGGSPGGCFLLLKPFVILGALFLLGLVVRQGDLGLEPMVLSMPVTGFVYAFIFRPVTYFNEDTALMFRESVHAAVMEAIDQVTTAQGVRGLSPEARRLPEIQSKPPETGGLHLHLT